MTPDWTVPDGKRVTGESMIFEGQFIVAIVTRREDAEKIVRLHNRELEAPELEGYDPS